MDKQYICVAMRGRPIDNSSVELLDFQQRNDLNPVRA